MQHFAQIQTEEFIRSVHLSNKHCAPDVQSQRNCFDLTSAIIQVKLIYSLLMVFKESEQDIEPFQASVSKDACAIVC